MADPLSADEFDPGFRSELTAINLNRIRWFQILALGAAVCFLIYAVCDKTLAGANVFNRTVLDIFLICFMLVLTTLALKLPALSRWRQRMVWLAVTVLVAGLQSWYFIAVPTFGQNPDYIMGLFISGTLVLLPPRHFWWLLIVSHIVYCSLLFVFPFPSTFVVAALSDGTLGVLIAGFVSRLLYRGKLADFHQRKLILAKNAELEELMVIAAHDLRSPLLGVRDLLNLGQRKLADAEFLKRMLEHTSSTCTELETLIGRMIDAHAAEHHGRQERLLPREDLRSVIQGSVKRLQAAAEAKGISLLAEVPETPAIAPFDPEALSQVLDNLLGNAVKYSPPGKKAGVKLHSGRDKWLVEVWDEGPGIPPEEESRLFRKFQRGRVRPTGGESSTGLGLFIVKTLIETMKGRVTYLPRTLGGACFQLELEA